MFRLALGCVIIGLSGSALYYGGQINPNPTTGFLAVGAAWGGSLWCLVTGAIDYARKKSD